MAKKKRRGGQRKSSGKLKSENLLVRLEPAEKQTFQTAADLAGLPVSTWVRERLRRAASRELEEAGVPIPFLAAPKIEGNP